MCFRPTPADATRPQLLSLSLCSLCLASSHGPCPALRQAYDFNYLGGVAVEEYDEDEIRRMTVSKDDKEAQGTVQKKKWAKNNAMEGRGLTPRQQQENQKKLQLRR